MWKQSVVLYSGGKLVDIYQFLIIRIIKCVHLPFDLPLLHVESQLVENFCRSIVLNVVERSSELVSGLFIELNQFERINKQIIKSKND